MNEQGSATTGAATVLGVLLVAGLGLLGYQLSGGLQHFRGATERVVTVKGLAEREVPADTISQSAPAIMDRRAQNQLPPA